MVGLWSGSTPSGPYSTATKARHRFSLSGDDQRIKRGDGATLLDVHRRNDRVPAVLFGAQEGAEVLDRLPDRHHAIAAKRSFHVRISERGDKGAVDLGDDCGRRLRRRQ